MAVLTISREIGSGGPEIGRMVADALGYHYADKKTMDEVFRQYGFVPFEKVYESSPSFWDRFDNMRRLTMENLDAVIRALAQHGNMVIVGRGSFAVLGDFSDVINVRLQAPFDLRLDRFMAEQGVTDRKKAARDLENRGSQRSAFVESTYNLPWDAASQFDLVIDAGKIDLKTAARWLAEALAEADGRSAEAGRSAREIGVEPYLAAAVKGALDCEKNHWG
jgi:cytidylate kinase